MGIPNKKGARVVDKIDKNTSINSASSVPVRYLYYIMLYVYNKQVISKPKQPKNRTTHTYKDTQAGTDMFLISIRGSTRRLPYLSYLTFTLVSPYVIFALCSFSASVSHAIIIVVYFFKDPQEPHNIQ